jgi:hypothetical protein
MSAEEKQIANLKKQNEGMESSFQTRGIKFTKLSLDSMDPEAELLLLKDYNNYLKGIAAANKPAAPVKEEKPKVVEKKEEDDEEELVKEIKPVFSTITNMEDIKRAFFSKDYDLFHELIKDVPFKFYKANYKYANDNDGKPEYVAKNLLQGFVQGLDDYRKYFLTCFRCLLYYHEKVERRYIYPSYWIVNSNDDLNTILGSIYDDYEFTLLVNEEQINKMLTKMEKITEENDIGLRVGEKFLH